MNKRLLVTGGLGFIGSNFIRFVLRERPDWSIINLDAMTYSGNKENLAKIASNPRYSFILGDIVDAAKVESLMNRVDAVVHFAAESHVDRSIFDSRPFVLTNVVGTQTLLDAVKRSGGKQRFLHVSTDEVYGSLPLEHRELRFSENDPIKPNSPYAASKAAADCFVRAAHHTFKLDTVITRCSNNFGPYQFPEKIIPLFVTNLLEGRKVPLYGDGLNVRDWLHVDDHAEALLTVLENGASGEIYNIGGCNERSNLELTRNVLDIMGFDEKMIEHVEDRLGHDRRYAVDASKITNKLGWRPTRSAWPEALASTIDWYRSNTAWWRRIRDRSGSQL